MFKFLQTKYGVCLLKINNIKLLHRTIIDDDDEITLKSDHIRFDKKNFSYFSETSIFCEKY